MLIQQVKETELIQKNQARKLKAFIGEEARFTEQKAQQMEYPVTEEMLKHEQKESEARNKADLALKIMRNNMNMALEQKKIKEEFEEKEEGPTEEELEAERKEAQRIANEERMQMFEEQIAQQNKLAAKELIKEKMAK